MVVEATRSLLRGLKGGGGGGGGGGGSSSYGSGSDDGNLVVIIIGGVISVVVAVVWCIYQHARDRSSREEFDAAVAEAKRKQKVSDGDAPFRTYKATFDVRYTDRGTEHSGTNNITLTHQAGGYKIKGDCSDADGRATITDGFVSHRGYAWWLEETPSWCGWLEGGDKGLKVLSEGKFDFPSNTLTGYWRADSGARGTYTQFKGNNVFKTFYPSGSSNTQTTTTSNSQTLEHMLEEDIPLAVATVETQDVPVIQAVAEPAADIPTASAFPSPSAPPMDSGSSQDLGPREVKAWVTKPSKDCFLGIGLTGSGGAVRITSIYQSGLFARTNLKVGQVLGTINGEPCDTADEAVARMQATKGIVIVAYEEMGDIEQGVTANASV